MDELWARVVAIFGIGGLIGFAWLCSSDRRRIPWRVVAAGLGLQFGLGLLLLRTAPGRGLFLGVNDLVNQLVTYTEAGSRFVFGPLKDQGFSFVLDVLPIIVFMGSIFGILYHLGVVQKLVALLARLLSRWMGTSGAESLAAVANIFVGMTEAPLLVRPYIEGMTRSELFTLMVTGMATIAGSVLVAYAQILGGGDFAGHLVTASLLSAPAAILIAKVMIPESGTPVTSDASHSAVAIDSVNVIDAASQGALAALKLAAYVGALVMSFVALIALLNGMLGALGGVVGVPELTLQKILGLLFAPFALLMGIPLAEATSVGSLLGVKTALNEFIAFQDLATLREAGGISERSAIITSYALCGFANFGSLAILIGGIGGMAPSRRSEVAELGLRSILAGTLATLMTGCVAGILL